MEKIDKEETNKSYVQDYQKKPNYTYICTEQPSIAESNHNHPVHLHAS